MIKVATIKKLMAVQGINGSELARRTGLNRSSISRILNGKLNPQQDTLKRIADELGVSPLELLEEEHSVFTRPNGVTMRYIAIFDDNFFDDDELTIIALDKNGVMHKIPLKPLASYMLTLPDGQSIYLTQGHIDALMEYEKQVTIKETLERFNKTFDEIPFAENHKVFHDISLFAGCDKCPAHISCSDAYHSIAPNCYHYNKTEEEFKAWLKAEGWVKGEKNSAETDSKALNMIDNGFSSHDCEGHWKCPKCGKDYGDWGFFNLGLKGGDTFVCEQCGTTLNVPY